MISLIYSSEVAQKQFKAQFDPWKIGFAGFFSASLFWQVRGGWVWWINAIPKMVSPQRERLHIFLSVSDSVMGFWNLTTLKAEQIFHSNIIENGVIYMKNCKKLHEKWCNLHESWWLLRFFSIMGFFSLTLHGRVWMRKIQDVPNQFFMKGFLNS